MDSKIDRRKDIVKSRKKYVQEDVRSMHGCCIENIVAKISDTLLKRVNLVPQPKKLLEDQQNVHVTKVRYNPEERKSSQNKNPKRGLEI